MPGISFAMADGAITALTIPIAMVARAPIERRAIIIGKVNVIALATLAYAGHDTRMIKPATVATITHTANPATTPIMFLAIVLPSNDQRQSSHPRDRAPSRRSGSLGEVIAARLGKIGHVIRHQVP